jgi:hypothetical protein
MGFPPREAPDRLPPAGSFGASAPERSDMKSRLWRLVVVFGLITLVVLGAAALALETPEMKVAPSRGA